MKFIREFSDFNEILYIFDLDDTLVSSDSFEDLAIKYLKEDVTIKSLLNSSVRRIGVKLSDLKWENGRIYVNDPELKIEPNGNWVRKKSRVYLITPDKFYFQDMSLPNKTKDLYKLYNAVKNKCIVTGRINDIKEKLVKSIEELGLEYPNYGIYCYPSKGNQSDKIAIWKGKTIIKLIKDNGFKRAIFYDDNSKWVNKVNQMVKTEIPDIDWLSFKVK